MAGLIYIAHALNITNILFTEWGYIFNINLPKSLISKSSQVCPTHGLPSGIGNMASIISSRRRLPNGTFIDKIADIPMHFIGQQKTFLMPAKHLCPGTEPVNTPD